MGGFRRIRYECTVRMREHGPAQAFVCNHHHAEERIETHYQCVAANRLPDVVPRLHLRNVDESLPTQQTW